MQNKIVTKSMLFALILDLTSGSTRQQSEVHIHYCSTVVYLVPSKADLYTHDKTDFVLKGPLAKKVHPRT
jgi:hypothetical protein